MILEVSAFVVVIVALCGTVMRSRGAKPDILESATSTQEVGERVGRYRLTGELESSQDWVLYQAVDKKAPQDILTVKVLSPFQQTKLAAERLKREGQLALKLRHSSIVETLDWGLLSGDRPYVVRRAVAGKTLAALLSQGALTPERTLAILLPITKALAYLHQSGLLHRNLKSRKIVVPEEGPPVIVDFGFVKPQDPEVMNVTQVGINNLCVNLSGGEDKTRGAAWVGALGYYAPELFQGKDHTPHTDQYALGTIFYEALCGRLPVEGMSFAEALVFKQKGSVQPLYELNEAVSSELSSVVDRMLATEAEKRFASLSEAAKALEGQSPVG